MNSNFVTNPASAPARDTWYADPARVFDNLYFVGGKVHSAWALTTSEGIILTSSGRSGSSAISRSCKVAQGAAQIGLEQQAAAAPGR